VVEELAARTRPAAGEPSGALVLFHGRGADEHDLYPLLDVLDPERRLLGVTLRGPLSLPPGGAHWYVVPRVGYPDPETFLSTFDTASAQLDRLEIPSERRVLGWFSQGAVMAHSLGLGRGRPRPAGIIGLSGFLPVVEGFELDLGPPLPRVAIGHGTYDAVIPVEFGRAARERLEEAGADVVYRESPMQHAIDPGYLAELQGWLRETLPPG
jgi:phospholipase/carboxylesterase